jgi:hypothetical protein
MSMTTNSTPGNATVDANVTTSTNPSQSITAHAINITSHEAKAAPSLSAAQALSTIEGAKQLAAYTAVDHHVLRHHKVCGYLFSCFLLLKSSGYWYWIWSVATARRFGHQHTLIGSTVPYVVDRIVQQGKEANTGRVFIPTGMFDKEVYAAL